MKRNDTPAPAEHVGSLIRTAVGRLEPGICEAALMAGIAVQLAADLLSDKDGMQFASDEQCEQLLFATMQAARMIEASKAAYYAALEGA